MCENNNCIIPVLRWEARGSPPPMGPGWWDAWFSRSWDTVTGEIVSRLPVPHSLDLRWVMLTNRVELYMLKSVGLCEVPVLPPWQYTHFAWTIDASLLIEMCKTYETLNISDCWRKAGEWSLWCNY
jgi:hypothetical protein